MNFPKFPILNAKIIVVRLFEENGFLEVIFIVYFRRSQHTFVRLQDVLKTSSSHVFKLSPTHLQRNNFSSFKTSSRSLQDALEDERLLRWRRLQDKENAYWGYLYLTNLIVYLANLYLTNLYLTSLMRIQNALIRTQ